MSSFIKHGRQSGKTWLRKKQLETFFDEARLLEMGCLIDFRKTSNLTPLKSGKDAIDRVVDRLLKKKEEVENISIWWADDKPNFIDIESVRKCLRENEPTRSPKLIKMEEMLLLGL